jgi:hypothetical protein
MDGLEEDFEVMAADAGVAHEVGSGGLAGEQQDAARGDHGADLNGGLDAAHAGHDDIGEEDFGDKMARGLDGFLAAVDGGGFEAILVENQSQSIGDDAFIVGDEDSGPDSAVGGTRVHEAFGRNSKLTWGLCSEYRLGGRKGTSKISR